MPTKAIKGAFMSRAGTHDNDGEVWTIAAKSEELLSKPLDKIIFAHTIEELKIKLGARTSRSEPDCDFVVDNYGFSSNHYNDLRVTDVPHYKGTSLKMARELAKKYGEVRTKGLEMPCGVVGNFIHKQNLIYYAPGEVKRRRKQKVSDANRMVKKGDIPAEALHNFTKAMYSKLSKRFSFFDLPGSRSGSSYETRKPRKAKGVVEFSQCYELYFGEGSYRKLDAYQKFMEKYGEYYAGLKKYVHPCIGKGTERGWHKKDQVAMRDLGIWMEKELNIQTKNNQ